MTEYKSKVKYEAPIEINIEEDFPDLGSMAVSEIENMICSAVLKVGITVDKEELIKALRYDRGQYEKGYADGKRDAADAIEALQAEQKKTVTQIFGEERMAWEGRCKDLLYHIENLQAQLPKRGEWIPGREIGKEYFYDKCITYYEGWHCSNCNVVFEQENKPKYNYCPNCGAKMDGERKEVEG